MIKKYRKKPVVVEAMQLLDVDSAEKICLWASKNRPDMANRIIGIAHYNPLTISIETLEGTMYAHTGHWIIRGIKGEFYPCKNDIFQATYEEVSDEQMANRFR